MAMIGKVKRMYFREKKSVREIVRLTSLSRNAVRKWLKTPVLEEPRYRRGEAPGKLTPFVEAIKQALKVDAHRPRHERRTARALHAQIKAEGYAGGYSRVTDFIRAWRQGEGQSVSTKAFVPLAFELVEAFQFDWSEEGLVVGGIYYRMQVSHLKLCASRAFCERLAVPRDVTLSRRRGSRQPAIRGLVSASGAAATLRCGCWGGWEAAPAHRAGKPTGVLPLGAQVLPCTVSARNPDSSQKYTSAPLCRAAAAIPG
jgi:hypothetical protein